VHCCSKSKSYLRGSGVEVEGYTKDEVAYHAELAEEAGLIKARFLKPTNEFAVERLTYEGHEFLDAARSDKMWNKARDCAEERGNTHP
jgi:Hypothetical protein (DUF2513)